LINLDKIGMALFIIADDSHRVNRMKGRGGYTDDVIPPRRKPVKIEDVDNMYLGSRKAARISDYAMDDGEDLSRRSQKKDRALLDDITTKLVNAAYAEPAMPLPRRGRRPPVAPSSYAGRKPIPTSPAYSSHSLPRPRRVGIRPTPAVPLHSYRPRSNSMPTRYVEEEVVTPYNFYEVAPPPRTHYYKAYRRELGVDDGAYGEDIYYAPLPPTGSAGPAREVRARTASRGAAAAGAGGGGRATVRRRPGSLPPSAGRNRINQAEIERYLNNGPARPKNLDNYDMYEPVLPNGPIPTSFATLRSKTNEAKNKVDKHKVLMDRYLPIYFGPENEVPYEVDYMYGELVDRMPGLDPYRPKQGSAGSYGANNYGGASDYGGAGSGGYSGTAIAPYAPARISKGPSSVPGLPPK